MKGESDGRSCMATTCACAVNIILLVFTCINRATDSTNPDWSKLRLGLVSVLVGACIYSENGAQS